MVDDNEGIRELYALEFESLGHDVVLARDGEQALEKCRHKQPDLVVLDIGMPEKDGLEVLGEIAAMNGGTPVIVNTAYPMFKLDYRARKAVAWLEKSSNLKKLLDTVEEILSKNHQ